MHDSTTHDARHLLRPGTLREELRALWLYHACPDLQSLPADERWLAARAMAKAARPTKEGGRP